MCTNMYNYVMQAAVKASAGKGGVKATSAALTVTHEFDI
jgi:hypothetical protein